MAPEVTVGVHGHGVGRADILGHGDQDPAVGDRAPFGIEGERVDDTRAAVHQVHRGAVDAPAQAVGHRQAVEDQLGPTIPVEAVERSASGTVVIGQRAGLEPTLRIASATVHPSP
jgi:hypothetical protein